MDLSCARAPNSADDLLELARADRTARVASSSLPASALDRSSTSLMSVISASADALERAHEAALLGIERGVLEQRRHADDAVERRAQLVAHVREEKRFGVHRGLRGQTRAIEVRRDPFLRRDVGDHGGDADDGAVLADQRCLRDEDVVGLAAGRHDRSFHSSSTSCVSIICASVARWLVVCARLRRSSSRWPMTSSRETPYIRSQASFARVIRAVGLANRDRQGQRLEQRVHHAQRVRERDLGLLAIGDLGVRASHAHGPAVGVRSMTMP